MAISIGAASTAALQRDPYAAAVRRQQGDARGADPAAAAAARLAERSETDEASESPATAAREPRGEATIRPVTVLRETQASGPARAALDSYRAVEQNTVSTASEGELVGIDLFV